MARLSRNGGRRRLRRGGRSGGELSRASALYNCNEPRQGDLLSQKYAHKLLGENRPCRVTPSISTCSPTSNITPRPPDRTRPEKNPARFILQKGVTIECVEICHHPAKRYWQTFRGLLRREPWHRLHPRECEAWLTRAALSRRGHHSALHPHPPRTKESRLALARQRCLDCRPRPTAWRVHLEQRGAFRCLERIKVESPVKGKFSTCIRSRYDGCD